MRHTGFVLIPGAWMGAWAWGAVAEALRSMGHPAYPITLTGLESAARDVSSVGLATHVDDVMTAIGALDLDRIVLVAHSYSGIVAGQVADRLADRVAHTVFIQAFPPEDGRSMLDVSGLDPRHELALIDESGGRWPAPGSAEIRGEPDLSAAQIEWLLDRFVDHPGRTVAEPAVLGRPLRSMSDTPDRRANMDRGMEARRGMRSAPVWLAFGVIAATLTACSGGGPAPGEQWTVGEDVRLEGRVIAVDATPMVVDGDGEITLDTAHGTVLIRIPARENLCEARGLDVFWTVASGDSLRLNGRATRPGEVTVCSAESHFLEMVGPQ